MPFRPSLRSRWLLGALVVAAAIVGVFVAVDHGTGDGVRIVPQLISGPVAQQAGRAAQRFAPGAQVVVVTQDLENTAQFDVDVRLPSGQRETIAVDNRFHPLGPVQAQSGGAVSGGQ